MKKYPVKTVFTFLGVPIIGVKRLVESDTLHEIILDLFKSGKPIDIEGSLVVSGFIHTKDSIISERSIATKKIHALRGYDPDFISPQVLKKQVTRLLESQDVNQDDRQAELYQDFITILKKGGLPTTVGMTLINEQVDEIEAILKERKRAIDHYFDGAIKSRVEPSK